MCARRARPRAGRSTQPWGVIPRCEYSPPVALGWIYKTLTQAGGNRLFVGCLVDLVINKLARPTFLRTAGLAAGAAAISAAAVLVTASAAGYPVPFLSTSSQVPSASAGSLDQVTQPSA